MSQTVTEIQSVTKSQDSKIVLTEFSRDTEVYCKGLHLDVNVTRYHHENGVKTATLQTQEFIRFWRKRKITFESTLKSNDCPPELFDIVETDNEDAICTAIDDYVHNSNYDYDQDNDSTEYEEEYDDGNRSDEESDYEQAKKKQRV